MLWVLLGVVALGAADNSNQVPQSAFSCEGRITGYYADVDSGCQVYHMCDGLGRQFSYTCPNATLFQQRMLICDHWYMVNCSKSVDDYKANLRIGRKMPFVDDSESNPYYRTPRPDLLSHPSESEYDIIYRTGRAQFGTNFNLVGAEPEKHNSTTSSTTDEPTYSLPSHWSTEYDQQATTAKPKDTFNAKKNLDSIGTVKGKPIIPLVPVTEFPVNYKSSFKATTPVFPKTVDVSTVAPDDVGLVPPIPYQIANRTETNTERIQVNFQSNFKATTPVYPKTVDITSEEPAEAGVLPPSNSGNTPNTQNVQVPSLSLDILPPSVDPNRSNVQELPSKFYQPPKFDPAFTDVPQPSEENTDSRKSGFKALNNDEWKDLRKKLFIPDYEFPLETSSGPSYDTVYSSFEANASGVPSKKK